MFFDSPEVIAWLLLALPVGLFATQFINGRYSLAGKLGVAILGSVLGGLAAASLRLEGQAGMLASILASGVGAIAATGLARALPGRARA